MAPRRPAAIAMVRVALPALAHFATSAGQFPAGGPLPGLRLAVVGFALLRITISRFALRLRSLRLSAARLRVVPHLLSCFGKLASASATGNNDDCDH